jgi:RNase adapter protein RapZ
MAPRGKVRPNPENLQLVILTGLSGSGKSTVLKTFEDFGYYCVDNLPVQLIPVFSELHHYGGGDITRAALLVDAREGGQLKRFPELFKEIQRDLDVTLVFIEASEESLLRRFSETRRPHPLGRGRTVRESLRHEREVMAPIRKLADVIIDTSRFNVHELRQFIQHRFERRARRPLIVSIVSFGYRYGIPADADLVFDVRFLPNPHFVPSLRKYSGKDAKIARYILSFPQSKQFLKRIESLLLYLIPHYIREGKSYLTVALGCTGGRHRSVMMADSIRHALAARGYTVKAVHRDLEREITG